MCGSPIDAKVVRIGGPEQGIVGGGIPGTLLLQLLKSRFNRVGRQLKTVTWHVAVGT